MFTNTDFDANNDGISSHATLAEGPTAITATIVADDTDGGATLIVSTANSNTQFLGVAGTTDETNGNVHQTNRIDRSQSIALSFDTPVWLDGISFNNLLTTDTGSEIAVVTSAAFEGLDYDRMPEVFTSQHVDTGMPGAGATWGYAGTSFNIQTGEGGRNAVPEILFGVDGYQRIFIPANTPITFATSTSDAEPTQGGYGIASFTVAAVPEPTALVTLVLGAFVLSAAKRKRYHRG